MAQTQDDVARSDAQRIRDKAKELWSAEGKPAGREEDFLTQAREIIAIEDSQADTLKPIGEAGEPVEPVIAMQNLGDLPDLADQGEQRPPSLATAAATADVGPMGPPGGAVVGPMGPPGGAAEDERGDASGAFVRHRAGGDDTSPNPGGASSAAPTVLTGGDATQTGSGLDREGLDRDPSEPGDRDPMRPPFRG